MSPLRDTPIFEWSNGSHGSNGSVWQPARASLLADGRLSWSVCPNRLVLSEVADHCLVGGLSAGPSRRRRRLPASRLCVPTLKRLPPQNTGSLADHLSRYVAPSPGTHTLLACEHDEPGRSATSGVEAPEVVANTENLARQPQFRSCSEGDIAVELVRLAADDHELGSLVESERHEPSGKAMCPSGR